MNKTLIVISFPLISWGDYSAKYTGTTIAARPTPQPTTNLPIIKIGMVGAVHIKMAPNVNSTSAIKIVFFLPILSATTPPNKDENAAPIKAIETMVSLSKSVMSGKEFIRYKLAPAITPVS